MAYTNLKQEIDNYVYENHENEILGKNLQKVLKDMVDVLGNGYRFMGVARTNTTIPAPEEQVFYLVGNGEYRNFGSTKTVPLGFIGVMYYDTQWNMSLINLNLNALNLNYYEGGSAIFSNRGLARQSVPNDLRHKGLIISYVANGIQYCDLCINSASAAWGDDASWFQIYPFNSVSVSQNIETDKTELMIGDKKYSLQSGYKLSEKYNVVSGNANTHEYDVNIKQGDKIKVDLFDADNCVGGSITFYIKYVGDDDYTISTTITTSTPYTTIANKDIDKVRFYKYNPIASGEIGVQIDLIEKKEDYIFKDIANTEIIAINKIVDGKYIDNTGTLQNGSSYGVYLVSLPASKAFICNARVGAGVCVFALYDDGIYKPLKIATDNVTNNYYYVNVTGSDIQLAICAVKNEYTIQYIIDGISVEGIAALNDFSSKVTTIEKVHTTEERTYGDGYIQTDGTIVPASSCRTTNSIILPANAWIKATARGFANVSAIFSIPLDIANGLYSPLLIADSNVAKEYYYFNGSGTDMEIVINYVKETLADVVFLKGGVIDEISKTAFANNGNPCFFKGSDGCRIFKKILCIGDSLTEGRFDYHDGAAIGEVTLLDYSYPTYLKTISGRDTTNKGDAGQTTKTWWNIHQNDDLSGHDACIIALGRNDYVPDRATTSEERHTYMANIINKVRTENNRIKVFVATMLNYYTGDAADAVNEDMRDIAQVNNCYLIDISRYGKLVSGADNYSHLTAMGYEKLANYYFNYISQIIANNPSAFRDVQFVGTNYEW